MCNSKNSKTKCGGPAVSCSRSQVDFNSRFTQLSREDWIIPTSQMKKCLPGQQCAQSLSLAELGKAG